LTHSAANKLFRQIESCTLCDVPLGPKPIFQAHPAARLLIAGQAPGSKTHERGVPFDDASGDRLRQWLGVTREQFYNEEIVAVVPMGFCYPGTGTSGDLPPRPECADTWRERVLQALPNIELTVIIGRYAIDWHLPEYKASSVTQVAKDWRQQLPAIIALPHPSPRNNRWLKQNPWFETDVIPVLRQHVARLLPG
jgi:uracil-DNA glycosylase